MVNEKAASVKSKADQVVVNRKFAPLLTLVTAIIAFALALVALLSKGGTGLERFDLITLNTSTLFQNAIKISSTTGTPTRSLELEEDDGVALPLITDPAVLLDARQLPSPGDVASWFNSVGSGFSSAVNPARPTSTSSSSNGGGGIIPGVPSIPGVGGNGGGGTGNFLQDIEGLFNSLIGAATGAAGEAIITVVNGLIAEVLDALGIDEYYSLYMNEYCSGDYTPNYAAPNAKKTLEKCTPYADAIPDIPKTNSTIQLGTTIIDFSALNIPNKLSGAGGALPIVFKALFAIQVIGIVACGLLILITPLTILLSLFQRFLVRAAIAALASLATTCFGLIAIVETVVMVVISVLVNSLMDGLGIEAQRGGAFLALLWISFVFMAISTVAWFLKWHKDTYIRRAKEDKLMSRPLVETTRSTYQLGPMEGVRGDRVSSESDRRSDRNI